MQNNQNYLEAARYSIQKEAQCLSDLVTRIDSSFDEAVKTIVNHKGKIVICGVGKSGLIAQKIAATMSSTGTPAVFLHACDAVHGDLGIYEAGDPTILISNSGSTVECVRLMPTLKQFNSPLIALLGNIDSPMAKDADIVLNASVDSESDPLGIVPTSSAISALALGDALACALMKARNFTQKDFAKFHPAGQLGRNMSLKVSDVMIALASCPCAKKDTKFGEVLVSMTEKPTGAACILDDDSNLIGLITDGDIRRALNKNVNIYEIFCEEIMTKKPVNISSNDALAEAVALMEHRPSNKRLSVLPVIDENGKALGLIRLHDIYQPQQ